MMSMRTSSRAGRPAQVLALARDATLALPRSPKGVFVRAERGTLVVTQAGDPEDHVLAAGDSLFVPPGGLAVAWALTPAVLVVRDAERLDVAEAAAA